MDSSQSSSGEINTSLIGRLSEKLKYKNDNFSSKINLTLDDVNILLNELQVYQLELEMQNDELKTSYLTLDRERAKFVGLFDLAPVGYFILNYLGVVEEANQNGIDLLNVARQTVRHQRFQSFISPQSWEDFYNFLHRMQYNDIKQTAEIKLKLAGDQIVYTRMEGRAISSIIVTDVKYYITVIDVTESRNAQQVLKETKERLEMTLKASATGTWTICAETSSVFLDPHSFNIMGIKSWAFNGTIAGLIALIHPDDQQQVNNQLLGAIHGVKDIDLEFRIITADNDFKYIAAKGHEINMQEESSYFAGILTDITERKRLEREAESLKNDQQKLILSATLTAQEKERNIISSALHDSVCQLLYGIKLNLESVERTNYLKGEFKNVNALLDQVIKETRQISYELTPTVLKDFGFVAGIKEMAQRTSTTHFHIDTYIDSTADFLGTDVQLYIFRMIQELINNCIKHAKATKAEIKVRLHRNQVFIRVADNGIGFNSCIEQAGHIGSGLSGIKNRVYLLNGQVKFYKSKQGMVVTITFENTAELSV
ncbi:PAS domain-containing protein [Pedobacter cryoconitis]|uniref:PAS domain-containing sensor histidine kinase n=1 Tax=Pedobacter cryoconitis TaxID=188932 RepID=UPI00160FF5FB|nr:PAS domain-containing protein [Pedobacter cryoconitis]MBB5644485.1 PAS domain S-box-containing protein [Pedobacter cryoconitis]